MVDSLSVEGSTTSVIEIDGDGDVVFELSSPKPADGKTHLLVSSKALSLVSPVLEKLFAWETPALQGKISSASENLATLVPENRPTRKSRTPLVIALPEDDTETFTLLCKITHHQMSGVPATLEPDSMAMFASMCHKYDCIKAVSHSSFRWLQAMAIENHNAGDLNKLLFAAFVLDMPEAFERISAKILLFHRGPFLELPGFSNQDLAPSSLLAEFVAKHATFTMELKDALHRTIGNGGSCIHAYSRRGDYYKHLASRGLWVSSYAYLIKQNDCLDRFFVPDMPEPMGQYCNKGAGCWECNKYRAYSFNQEFAKEKEKVVKGLTGLCLDCVSTGRESFWTGECRIKHAF